MIFASLRNVGRPDGRQNRVGSMRILEKTGIYAGSVLLAFAGLMYVDGLLQSRAALAAFEVGPVPTGLAAASTQVTVTESAQVRTRNLNDTLAVLEIPSVGIEVPVFNTIGKLVLNRGAGHVEGTSLPGATGNIAIAGHRDTFFRGLKSIRTGDAMALITHYGRQRFRVEEIRIVDALDVSVLDPTAQTVLTLITCYPFNYIGYAPDRFVVRGVLDEAETKTNAVPARPLPRAAAGIQGE